jgi:aspartate/methionine/tyrosine aminotransferase
VGLEVGSFSYHFGLPALPFGFAVGNREAINGLKRIAPLTPAHTPAFYVDLALQAIRKYPGDGVQALRERVTRTSAAANDLLDLLVLERCGLPTIPYIWARITKRAPSTSLARTILRRYKVMVAPGFGFGENGEGFLRLSLLAGPEAYSRAVERVRKGRAARLRGKE